MKLLLATALLFLLMLVIELWKAPEGYEDRNGFHVL